MKTFLTALALCVGLLFSGPAIAADETPFELSVEKSSKLFELGSAYAATQTCFQRFVELRPMATDAGETGEMFNEKAGYLRRNHPREAKVIDAAVSTGIGIGAQTQLHYTYNTAANKMEEVVLDNVESCRKVVNWFIEARSIGILADKNFGIPIIEGSPA